LSVSLTGIDDADRVAVRLASGRDHADATAAKPDGYRVFDAHQKFLPGHYCQGAT
jgi:hypothetical protein